VSESQLRIALQRCYSRRRLALKALDLYQALYQQSCHQAQSNHRRA
jgi:hypothetical protein